jgi:hypothetical protein
MISQTFNFIYSNEPHRDIRVSSETSAMNVPSYRAGELFFKFATGHEQFGTTF